MATTKPRRSLGIRDFGLLWTDAALADYFGRVGDALRKEDVPRIVYDWETEIATSRFQRFGVLVSFFHPAVGSSAIPVGFANPATGDSLSFETVWAAAGPYLGSADFGKVTHNGVFDKHVWRLHGCEVVDSVHDFDTLIASWLINPDPPHDLGSLGEMYGTKHRKLYGSIKELLRECRVKQTSQVPVSKLAAYASGDCTATYDLVAPMQAELERLQLTKNFEEEMAYRVIFDSMMWEGTPINRRRVQELHRQYEDRMRKIERRIYKIAGEPFNLDAPKQVGSILYGKLGLKPLGVDGKLKYTKGGKKSEPQPSTAAEVIEVLADMGAPICKAMLEYRTCAKIDGTYLAPYCAHLGESSRLYSDFNQTGTRTGRPSSSDPNLYNIPRPDTDFGSDGMAIRSVFVPPKGCKLLSHDYSQIELRLMAHFSEDANMIRVFRDGGDIHAETAEACNTDRHGAKIINFGIIYGMLEYALSRKLRCSVEEAALFLNRYYQRFPGVLYFRKQTTRYAARFGIVRTISGRLRRVDGIRSADDKERRHAENVAINTPIQGSASDIIKKAQYEVHRHIAPKYDAHVSLQIYDELVSWCPTKNVVRFNKEVTAAMTDVVALKVPIKVSGKAGPSWDKCKG